MKKETRFLNLQKFTPLCFGLALAAGAWGELSAADVAAGSNLTAALNGATAQNHEFNLLGDVNLSSTFSQNAAAREVIIIEGNGHTITRTGSGYYFDVSRAGSTLTINNATITGTATSGGYGAINVSGSNATLNLDGVVFDGNTAATGYGILRINTTGVKVTGNVHFKNNVSATSEVSAVHVGISDSVTFFGQADFSGNSTGYYGGAVAVREGASILFKEAVTFDGNFATAYFGGAIDMYGGNSSAVFEKDATFTNNYVKNTFNHTYGVRGGAINVGYLSGTKASQLQLQGKSTFADNYVWGTGTTVGVGGAISIAVAGGDPLGQGQVGSGFVYGADIAQGIFTDNYAYSEKRGGYGGAIFVKSYDGTFTLGSGSSFTGNAAKTLGGAIYFDQGTLNLNGNVEFSGNKQGASFDTSSGRPVYVEGTGSANAIYFAVSSNTATLNLANQSGEVISFADPIQSATGKTVTVNKTGAGKVVFTGHDSDILAQTTVSSGIFELGAGVNYGRLGTSATSAFSLSRGATLVGNAGSVLTATSISLAGRVEVTGGVFTLKSDNTSGVQLASSTVLSLVISDKDNYASLDLNGQKLDLSGATLEIVADGYVPSTDNSDFFTIITSVAGLPNGQFAQGDSIFINGAEFEILYNNGSVSLQQISSIPEPSTYALFGGAGLLGLLVLRRRQGA